MVRQTRNIPQAKLDLVSEAEKTQAELYHSNSDSLYHDGINVGKEGFYDPNAGHLKEHARRPGAVPTPVLATDPGQPKGIGVDLVSRELNKALDRSELGVVRSTGRKRATGAKDGVSETGSEESA